MNIISGTTILLQGKIDLSVYNFYLENYKNTPIVISTWEDSILDESVIDKSTLIIKSKYPPIPGKQNICLQLISTLNGLNYINTKYVIKIRGDETYSNLEYIESFLHQNDKLLYVTPIFFRKWDVIPYHISDHLIAGLTSNVFNMFSSSYSNYNSNYGYIDTVEVLLGKSYIDFCENKILDFNESNAQYMKKYYSILDLEKLKPYKIVANAFNKVWYDDFIVEDNWSISNISQII
jgi:hypothetical protein